MACNPCGLTQYATAGHETCYSNFLQAGDGVYVNKDERQAYTCPSATRYALVSHEGCTGNPMNCELGAYANKTRWQCIICPNGTIQNATKTGCTDCNGLFADEDHVNCVEKENCNYGGIANEDENQCYSCGSDEYATANHTKCI